MDNRTSLSRVEISTLLALASLPFVRALFRGLVSEDYIILRRLSEQPFWALTWEQISGPWMGATFVLFWRPVSTFILQVQELLWGVHPLGYLVVHLGAHLTSAALLFILARRLFPDQKWPARAVCLLFAVYPLHPNTVLFIASFATVYATTFGIASLVFFVESRRSDSRLFLIGSVLSFCLSMACYEGAFVLPALLISVDLLWSRERGAPFDAPALARRHIPFLALAGGYLVLRQLLLGTALGGYPGASFQLGSLWVLVQRLQPEWSLLLVPTYSWMRPPWIEFATRLALLAALASLLVRTKVQSGRMLFGLIWIMAARLPFGDTHIVPANGRYWYLAAAGIGFLVVGLAELVPRRARGRFLAAITVSVSLVYGAGLLAFANQYVAASELAARIRSKASILADSHDPTTARFLIGVPNFIADSRGNNVAQVFHWGLSDALSAPFADPAIRVFPLGPLNVQRIGPLASRPDLGTVWRWNGDSFSKVSVDPSPLSTIEVEEIADMTTGVRFHALDTIRYRVITVGRMNTVITPVPAGTGWQSAPLPTPFITSVRDLYRDELYVWLEGTDSNGRLVASSRLLELAPQ